MVNTLALSGTGGSDSLKILLIGPLNTEYISNIEIRIIRVRNVGSGKTRPKIVPTATPNVAITMFLRYWFPLLKIKVYKIRAPKIQPIIAKVISIQGYKIGFKNSIKYPCNQNTLAEDMKRPTAKMLFRTFSKLYLIAIIIKTPLTTAIAANKKPSRNWVVEVPSPGMKIPVLRSRA